MVLKNSIIKLASNTRGLFKLKPDNNKTKSGFRFLRYAYRGGVITIQLIALAVLANAIFHSNPVVQPLEPVLEKPEDGRKRVIILGSGWGATSLIKKLDPKEFDVVIVSPRNYFLFTPLLPSCTVGTLEHRSILESIRYIIRHKTGNVQFVEADCTKIDSKNNKITIKDTSEIQGKINSSELYYDYLVVAVGAETATFNIPGVKEYSCCLKEIWDAKKIRQQLSDCIETAAFAGQDEKEKERLLHMIVVGGGPTGVEYAAELQDYLAEDLKKWYPEIADKFKITLIEALPTVLPSFSKTLIDYTESTLRYNKINVLTKSRVQKVTPTTVTIKNANDEDEEIPYGLLVWAAGNTARPVVKDLITQFPEIQTNRRGILVDDHLMMVGSDNIFALGDATATSYAPTAQVASQQGKYLAKLLKSTLNADNFQEVKTKQKPFHYTHNGSLAYIGSEKAIADIPFMNINFPIGGAMTYLFWKSAYLSNLFSIRNAALVSLDWTKKFLYGRDISRE
ncbi:NADH dehydrogenase [Neoconidiobolus thromboides FSU 785]|nr:NADH dehydrogenase [Neoconidiobolus thromboides FSU 785]